MDREFSKDSDGIWRVEFDSVSEIAEIAMATGAGNNVTNIHAADHHIAKSGGAAFYNGYDRAKILDALDHPPEDLVLAVERIKDQLETTTVVPTGRRRRTVRQLEMGDELDPIAWVSRSPEGWSETRYQTERKHLVRIAVNISVNWQRKPDELLYRGAAAAALADALIVQGYSVEIVAFRSITKPAKYVRNAVTKIIVKRPDAPLDLAAVAFALSEIAFYRLIAMPANTRLLRTIVSGNWGVTAPLPDSDRAEFDIVLDSDILTEAAAIAVVNSYATGIT